MMCQFLAQNCSVCVILSQPKCAVLFLNNSLLSVPFLSYVNDSNYKHLEKYLIRVQISVFPENAYYVMDNKSNLSRF